MILSRVLQNRGTLFQITVSRKTTGRRHRNLSPGDWQNIFFQEATGPLNEGEKLQEQPCIRKGTLLA